MTQEAADRSLEQFVPFRSLGLRSQIPELVSSQTTLGRADWFYGSCVWTRENVWSERPLSAFLHSLAFPDTHTQTSAGFWYRHQPPFSGPAPKSGLLWLAFPPALGLPLL